LLDIDGVLTTSWEPLPGAVDSIRWLRAHHIDFRLITNTSSKSRRDMAALLAAAGMEVADDQIVTAVTSAARYLTEHYPGAGCFIVNEGDLTEDLHDVQEAGPRQARVVLLGGAGPSVGYDALDQVFKLAVDGVPVVALHRNNRFQTADGPALDMGAFIVGLEAAAGTEIPIVGKPAPAFFNAALAALGVDAADAVMVGDDIESDVIGAQALGITGVLVKTGKFRPADLDRPGQQPDHVIDDVGALADLVQRLGP
jgi:HAD superfamily hydrolase (TIGR01458 family)